MKTKDGGPAFPVDLSNETIIAMVKAGEMTTEECARIKRGMSMRDWFAGKAMESMAACNWAFDPTHHAEISNRAYLLADAMLAERERKKE